MGHLQREMAPGTLLMPLLNSIAACSSQAALEEPHPLSQALSLVAFDRQVPTAPKCSDATWPLSTEAQGPLAVGDLSRSAFVGI